MKLRVQYRDFLKTIKEKDVKSVQDYNLVKKLHKKGFSKRVIKEKTKVTDDKLHQWRNTNIKPIAIKILEDANRRCYFKEINRKKQEWLSYVIGYNLGDGNISRNLCNVWFYGVNTDLEKIKKILEKFKVKPIIYTYKINNGKMAVHDRIFSRFLICFGAVVGDKTKSKIEIPKWILITPKASVIKRRFLQGLFDSELSSISKHSQRKNAYQSLKFYTSKQKNNIKDGILFLNQVINLLKEFNISASDIKLDREYKRGRDNEVIQQLYFCIHSNYINLYNFIKNIDFLFNSKRVKTSVEAFNFLKLKSNEELNKIKLYEKAILLRKKGLSAYEIARSLNIQQYHIKNWLYFNRKPSLYNFVKNQYAFAK